MPDESPLAGLVEASQERRTAHQFVRDTLRRAILNGALVSGARLVQADIASQLKVSTTPVREALRDLIADGLILFDPHRGAIVRGVDMAELVDVYEIRKALEPLAIRKAALRITHEELAAAEALQGRMATEKDAAAWADLNSQFHSLLERAAGSPRLESIVKSLQDASAIYVAHSLKLDRRRMAAGNREHRSLLAALRKRDADRAGQVLIAHLEATLQGILASRSADGRKRRPSTSKSTAASGAR
jgi:DNA-binding GntR family transcriptional regulator